MFLTLSTRRRPGQPVSMPIPQSVRDIHTSSVVTAVQIFRLQIILSGFEVETTIHTTKSGIQVCGYCLVFHISRAEEAKNIYDVEMHPRQRTVVVSIVRGYSLVIVQHITE